LSNSRSNQERVDHLRSGIAYLLAWAGVAIAGAYIFEDGGIGNVLNFKNGDFVPLLVVCGSIVLMALALRSMFRYFTTRSRYEQD
jgi:hypothetical protein